MVRKVIESLSGYTRVVAFRLRRRIVHRIANAARVGVLRLSQIRVAGLPRDLERERERSIERRRGQKGWREVGGRRGWRSQATRGGFGATIALSIMQISGVAPIPPRKVFGRTFTTFPVIFSLLSFSLFPSLSLFLSVSFSCTCFSVVVTELKRMLTIATLTRILCDPSTEAPTRHPFSGTTNMQFVIRKKRAKIPKAGECYPVRGMLGISKPPDSWVRS